MKVRDVNLRGYAPLACRAFIVICLLGCSAFGQTCPTEDPAIDSAKSQKLFLYFPATDDATFQLATAPGPAKAFDGATLTSNAVTTADLIEGIRKVVVDDYCEFNVQVLTTTTNPATLPSPPPHRVTVAVGSDSNVNTFGATWGTSRAVDTGDKVDIDFARVWAGTYNLCEGSQGPTVVGGACTTGALTGANNTLDHWSQAVGGSTAHEAGHTYGLAHTDDDPNPDPCTFRSDGTNQNGTNTPIPGDDPFNKLLMPAGCNLSGTDRANFRRHFGDWTFGLLATNLGLSIETMHNWDMVNPNSEQATSLAIDFLSPLAAVPPIAWTYTGSLSPWISPVVTGPTGTATFKGTTYNKYQITWSVANPAWLTTTPGILPAGATFHVGTAFTGVDFHTTDPIIIQNVTLLDGTTQLPLSPRLPSYNAGSLDAADQFTVNFTPPPAAPQLRMVNATIFQLPRVATIDSLVGQGAPFDRSGRPIQPWSSTTCGGGDVTVRDSNGTMDCTIAALNQAPNVLVSHHLGEPGVIDCSAPQPPPVVVKDSSFSPDDEGPVCAGTQRDPFPSTTVYIIATFEDPNALHFDPVTKKFVVGPVLSKVFYQFSGVRQITDLKQLPLCQGKAVIANSGQSIHNAGSVVQGNVQAALSIVQNSGSSITGSASSFLSAELTSVQPPATAINLNNVVVNSGQTINLPAGSYIASSLTLNGNATLITTGKVQIWAGSFVVGGTLRSASNNPNDLSVFVNSRTDVHVNSGGNFIGTLYAPNSNAALIDGTVHGCIVGGAVTLNSGGKILP